jgi:hypothetical protein
LTAVIRAKLGLHDHAFFCISHVPLLSDCLRMDCVRA